MLVDQFGGLSMDIGVLYLSHAMLILAELIVCSTRGFAWVPKPRVISEPTHTLEDKVLG